MNEVLGVRPFVPAKDYRKSMAFYEAFGFEAAHKDSSVVFKLDGFGFILQNFYIFDPSGILWHVAEIPS